MTFLLYAVSVPFLFSLLCCLCIFLFFYFVKVVTTFVCDGMLVLSAVSLPFSLALLRCLCIFFKSQLYISFSAPRSPPFFYAAALPDSQLLQPRQRTAVTNPCPLLTLHPCILLHNNAAGVCRSTILLYQPAPAPALVVDLVVILE